MNFLKYWQLDDDNWVRKFIILRRNKTSGLKEQKISFTTLHSKNTRMGYSYLSITFVQHIIESDINLFIMRNQNIRIENKKLLVKKNV